jgi:hypothetical protein
MSIEASTSTPVLLAYLEQVLVPSSGSEAGCHSGDGQLAPASRHGSAGAARPRAGIGTAVPAALFARVQPDRAAWAKMKERLKAKAARTLEALEAELKPALDTITAKDARDWIRHAGYALH